MDIRKKCKRKVLSFVLSIAVLLSIMPLTVLAQGNTPIYVKINPDTYICLYVELTDKIEDVKAQIEAKENIPVGEQELMFAGQHLENGKALQDYSIQKDSTLVLVRHQTGDYIVNGGEWGVDYIYENEVLKILSDKPITISGSIRRGQLVIEHNANITLSNYTHTQDSANANIVPVLIRSGKIANVSLLGTNSIMGNQDQHNDGTTMIQLEQMAELHFGGTGSIHVNGTNNYNGAGNGIEGGSVHIKGGTFICSQGSASPPSLANISVPVIVYEGGTVVSNTLNIANGIMSDTSISSSQQLRIHVPSTIAQGSSLHNDGSLVNNSTLTNDGTLTNNGTVTNDGIIINNGILTNNGIIAGKGTIICNNHMGGTATCTQKAVCALCGQAYGELETENHALTYCEGIQPSCVVEGTIAYWRCSGCNETFSDSTASTRVTDLVIPATGHNWSGNWIIDREPTTSQVGLKHMKCSVCNITSETVEIAMLPQDTVVDGEVMKASNFPQTGEHSMMSLWAAMFFASAGSVGVLIAKRKKSAK